jgi:hypothetical protein
MWKPRAPARGTFTIPSLGTPSLTPIHPKKKKKKTGATWRISLLIHSSKQLSPEGESFLRIDMYSTGLTTLTFNHPFIVPRGPISRRFTSTNSLGLTPDAISAEVACPDVLLASSRRKSCRGLYRLILDILTEERHFLPELKHWVSMPSIG